MPSANLRPLILDLSSLAAIRTAAADSQIHCTVEQQFFYSGTVYDIKQVLINDAAAAVGPFKLAVDNLESQIATDIIGPFLLTKPLTPKIPAARTGHYTPRVIFLSSGSHGVNFDPLGRPDKARYKPMDAYYNYQAKSACILVAIELSKRSKAQFNAFSLDPGGTYRSYRSSRYS